jgi:hypothetical protein
LNLKGMRLTIILATLALTLAILFGVKWLYQDQALDRPLARAVGAVPGVSETVIAQRGDILQVRVKVADTPEIETLVAGLWRAIDAVEGGRKVELLISDSRNPVLQEVYYDFHFFLQEAVATGFYSELPARLAEVAATDKVARARVYVAPDYVYVQLHQGDASLYEIVPRDSGQSVPGVAEAVTRSVVVRPWGG